MTSKTLYFNLIKEDLKRRTWNMALAMLAFFFALPVYTASVVSDFLRYQMDEKLPDEANRMYLMQRVSTIFKFDNSMIIALIFVASIICAVSGFSYLNSKKKVDLYHSMPVKREKLFVASFLNGILVVAIPYIVNIGLALLVVKLNKVSIGAMFIIAVKTYLIHMLFYILLYATAVLAMILTGNLIVGLLGIFVFYIYMPLMSLVIEGYFSTFFRTYYRLEKGILENLLYASPAFCYFNSVGRYYDVGQISSRLLIGIAIAAVIISVLGYLLYRKRPSEAAGKAMAFSSSKTAIKMLIVMLFSLSGALFGWNVQSNMGWAIFAMLCTLIISHSMIEIIYHFDFRMLFHHKRHLVLCAIMTGFVFCGFRYDIFSYDSYLPKESQVKSVAVNIRVMNNWMNSYAIGATTYTDAQWNSIETYVMEHMEVTDAKLVLPVAEKGIEYNNILKTKEAQPHWDQDEMEGELYTRILVNYKMASGNHVYRRYDFPLSTVMDSLEALYLNEEYKKGLFPILSQTLEETEEIYYKENGERVLLEIPESLLNVYQQDLQGLTIANMKKEIPIAMIQFRTKSQNEELIRRKSITANRNYNSYADIEDAAYYPIYPSFQATIDMLCASGIEPGQEIRRQELKEIKIIDEIGFRNIRGSTFYTTSPEIIDSVMSEAVWYEAVTMNPLQAIEPQVSVLVSVGSGISKKEYSYRFLRDQIPEWVKKELDYDEVREKIKKAKELDKKHEETWAIEVE